MRHTDGVPVRRRLAVLVAVGVLLGLGALGVLAAWRLYDLLVTQFG